MCGSCGMIGESQMDRWADAKQATKGQKLLKAAKASAKGVCCVWRSSLLFATVYNPRTAD